MKMTIRSWPLVVLALLGLAACNAGNIGRAEEPATTDDGGSGSDAEATADQDPGPTRFVTAYWAGWDAERYPIDHIDWSAITHGAIAFVLPREPTTPDGENPYPTLQTAYIAGSSGPAGMIAFAAAAHQHGAKALISLGGAGSGSAPNGGFAAAASSANRGQLIADILAACSDWDYDGVDLDWEDNINHADFRALVLELRAAAPVGFLMTVPVGAVSTNAGLSQDDIDLWGAVFPLMDQISPMSYCGTGAWPGWVTWHFNPLFGHGPDHPVDVASTLEAWAALGIPRAKLGVGLGFYSLAVGEPVTGVLQHYQGAAVYASDGDMNHGNIVRHFLGKGGATRVWDDTAQAATLSFPAPFQPADTWQEQYGAGNLGPTVQFISYEDEESIAAKGAWARENGYGGCIIWTINEGTRWPYGNDGYANPLLAAVKTAFLD